MSLRTKKSWSPLTILFCMCVGGIAGILAGIAQDFGIRNTLTNIRLNPETFLEQYLGILLVVNLLLVITGVLRTLEFLYTRRTARTATHNKDMES